MERTFSESSMPPRIYFPKGWFLKECFLGNSFLQKSARLSEKLEKPEKNFGQLLEFINSLEQKN